MKRLRIQKNRISSIELSPSVAGAKVDCGTDWIGTGAATFSIWAKASRRWGGSNLRLFDNGTTYMSLGAITSSSAVACKIVFISDGSADATGNPCSGSIPNITGWNNYTATRTAAGLVNFYINGVLSGTANQNTGTPGAATTNLIIGNNAAGTRGVLGNLLSNAMTFNRVLTAKEVENLARYFVLPDDADFSLQSFHPLDDSGTGGTARDLSRFNRPGTFTSCIGRTDVPTVPRKLITPNILRNSDFEFIPPGGNATTATAVWVDGSTAGRSDLNTNTAGYGWAINKGGTASVLFDNTVSYSGKASLKVSTLAIASSVEARGLITTPTIATLQQQGIPVLPNTTYTATYWMKTNAVSGDSTGGARMTFMEYSAAAGLNGTNASSYVKTSTEWTQYTITFTTAATTVFLVPWCIVYGHIGTATLIMDAWFDSISVVGPTPPVRLSLSQARTPITQPRTILT